MSRAFSWLVPRRIGTQIAILVITALALAHAALAAAFFLIDGGRPPRPPMGEIDRLVFAVRLIESEPDAGARAKLKADVQRADPNLLVLSEMPKPDDDVPERRLLRDREAPLDGATLFIAHAREGEDAKRLVVSRLTDGTILAVALKGPPGPLFLSPVAFGTLAFLASALILLSLWAARQLAAPLARFADAAENFTADGNTVPLAESGPLEVRRVAHSFNEMQARVLKLIDDRTRMLAAVGHDLRTPITRLRLRAEEIDDTKLRVRILRNLTTMENLVQSALWFLRGELEPGAKVIADLPSLVQTVCDDFSDVGQPVYYSGPSHLYVRCEPDQLMRALQNLIENGLKFGTVVDVRVFQEGSLAVVEIEDDGPGIPQADRERVLEPFYRGDSARNLSDGDSFGLGLSIAHTIVTRNGGRLELLDPTSGGERELGSTDQPAYQPPTRPDRQTSGLLARLVLPQADTDAAPTRPALEAASGARESPPPAD